MNGAVVGFAGMTHLGLVSAAATAARGFAVIAYDANAELIGALSSFRLPVVEPGLDELLADNARRLTFTADPQDLSICDVVYISVDVPTDDEARSDLGAVRALVDAIAPRLGRDSVLVILCQVPPGFTREISRVPQERLIYQVETLIFGRAVERAMHPERFIVGCSDPSKSLPPRYHEVLKAFGCPILTMRYESAELAKISINFCLVASVSVANTLAEVSEAIGADWAEIVPALKLDKRIGPQAYLAPGLGISGGNLERDLRTVLNICAREKTDGGIVEAWLHNSSYRKAWCWRVLHDRLIARNSRARIAVLGLAYKENTHSTKNSPSLELLTHLQDFGSLEIRVHDPVVSPALVPFAKGAETPLECVDNADALVIATPWPDYRELEPTELAQHMKGRLLIDPYRVLDGRAAVKAGFEYHALGMAPLFP
jgi:UDPglucose 6-dehydrogenase